MYREVFNPSFVITVLQGIFDSSPISLEPAGSFTFFKALRMFLYSSVNSDKEVTNPVDRLPL